MNAPPSSVKLQERRRQIFSGTDEVKNQRTASLDALSSQIPELESARRRHRLRLELTHNRNFVAREDCPLCQQNLGRHAHSFADGDGRLSKSSNDGRLYGRESAVTWLAGLTAIETARQRSRRATRKLLPALSSQAAAVYPELPAEWRVATLAEVDVTFALSRERVQMQCGNSTAVRPVIEAVVRKVREASDLDMEFSDDGSQLFDSPHQAAVFFGLLSENVA